MKGDWNPEVMTSLEAQRFLEDAMDLMLVYEDIEEESYHVDPEMRPAYDIISELRSLIRFENQTALGDHPPYVTITSGMRGYFAVLITWGDEDMDGGFYSPWNTGMGSYKTALEAEPEARAWAKAEEMAYVRPHDVVLDLAAEDKIISAVLTEQTIKVKSSFVYVHLVVSTSNATHKLDNFIIKSELASDFDPKVYVGKSVKTARRLWNKAVNQMRKNKENKQ